MHEHYKQVLAGLALTACDGVCLEVVEALLTLAVGIVIAWYTWWLNKDP